jgi:branched-chain amino acid transport system permease protein
MSAILPSSVESHRVLHDQVKWSRIEIAFWVCALLPFVLTPDYLSLASQVAITALFALSLDLILGYAGIVSLGHAAFFGLGAYSAGLVAKAGWGEPITGLFIAAVVAGLAGWLRDREVSPPRAHHDYVGARAVAARGG